MWAVSVFCLGTVMALCVIGTFSCKYDDNLAQRVGMAMLFVGLYPRVTTIWETESLAHTYITAEASFATHVGLFLFSCGLAVKVYLRNMRSHHEPTLHDDASLVFWQPWSGTK